MSHRQAFHTSCRNGLSGHAGFQFNAASAGLDERQLSSLAVAHAGYRAAPDAPAEPSPEQIERLPVALRYLPVDGLGPVISRTAYVGREFRGRDGEPDSGRFGNYFSHIVVGDAGGAEPFGGLMPVELWEAPHWTTAEAEGAELPSLERIDPGPVDLEAVLAELLPAREAALAPVLDACLRAVLGGPRVVLVEPDPGLASAWIAWVSFTLPPDRVNQLTFSTFEGRPRVAEGLRVCVTTPACELDFPDYELGKAVEIIDTSAPSSDAICLYARVAAALAGEGAEAVAAATRELEPGLDLDQAGANLAVLGRRTDLVVPAEVAAVLAVLRQALPRLSAEAALSLAAALPEEADSPATLAAWSRLHAAARNGDPDDPQLADLTLARVLGAAADPAAIEPVEPGAPVAPSVSVLAGWSSAVSAAAGSDRLGETIELGARLRLVGCNSALDRELASTVADNLDDPGVRRALDLLAAEGHDAVVAGVALEIAARAGGGGPLGSLRHVARYRPAREAVRARAEEDSSFEMAAAWELLRVEDQPARRADAVANLAALATTERQAELIRALYGEKGPSNPAEHAELLKGWQAAGRRAPQEDRQRALACLETLPLRPDPAAGLLFELLGGPSKAMSGNGEHLAWGLLFERPPQGRSFSDWTWMARQGQEPLADLPDTRLEEVRTLAARVAIVGLGEDRYDEGLADLVDLLGRRWLAELGDALGREVGRRDEPERLVALAFDQWGRSRQYGRQLLDEALPRATRDLSARRLEAVGERFGKEQRKAWEDWLEEHPPSRAVSRAVRGVLRRGEGKR
jgi:hypothetical protein